MHELVVDKDTEELTIRINSKTYEKRRDEWYRNRRPGEQIDTSCRYSNFLYASQKIVREINHENSKDKEGKARLAQQKWYKKTSKGMQRGKTGATLYIITADKK